MKTRMFAVLTTLLDVTAINTPSRENTAKANGKFVENNQVVIYNNGKKYTPAGVRK
jgi:hypothetical protein